jgi:hypothetical protein
MPHHLGCNSSLVADKFGRPFSFLDVFSLDSAVLGFLSLLLYLAEHDLLQNLGLRVKLEQYKQVFI